MSGLQLAEVRYRYFLLDVDCGSVNFEVSGLAPFYDSALTGETLHSAEGLFGRVFLSGVKWKS